MKKNWKNGFDAAFTLIELLVVVAIISILSAVVLASLNRAQARAADSAIEANLDNMRSQAASYYDTNDEMYSDGAAACTITKTGVLGSGCTNGSSLWEDPTMLTALIEVAKASGATVKATTNGADGGDSPGDAYAIVAVLKSDSTKGWCIDSLGSGKQIDLSVHPGALSECP